MVYEDKSIKMCRVSLASSCSLRICAFEFYAFCEENIFNPFMINVLVM